MGVYIVGRGVGGNLDCDQAKSSPTYSRDKFVRNDENGNHVVTNKKGR